MSEIYPIAVPKWGIEMVEGTITTWNKSEGDALPRAMKSLRWSRIKLSTCGTLRCGVLRVSLSAAADAHPVGHCWASLPLPT